VIRKIRRLFRRLRYFGVGRIPIKFRHPVDQLVFYADACGLPAPTVEQERAMRVHCDQMVEAPPP